MIQVNERRASGREFPAFFQTPVSVAVSPVWPAGLADYVARRVPIETVATVGDNALAWLDRNEWFKPTRLSPDL